MSSKVKQTKKNYKFDSMTLMIKTLRSFKMLEITHQKMQCNIPTHQNLQHQYYLWTPVVVKINSKNFCGISLLQEGT
jgi:hypothetical protein